MNLDLSVCRRVGLLVCLLGSIFVLLSCQPKPPVTTSLVYEVPKVLSNGCGSNALCTDFEGDGVFAANAQACPTTCSGNCGAYHFYFDNSSWMSLSIYTAMVYPGNPQILSLTQTDQNGQPVQPVWQVTLNPTVPTDNWNLMFRVNPQGTDLQLKAGADIKGHYLLTVLGGFQVDSALITIHAEQTVTTNPPNPPPATYLCLGLSN